ncbi:hypothetical protein BT93_J0700 [Corymbia citriodora subsp. variegata]|nr:hypothetical protein BT93_J0700 [Corymbia citriodora subsp. variegata]
MFGLRIGIQSTHHSRSQCIGSSPELPRPMAEFSVKVKKLSESQSPTKSSKRVRNSSGLNPHPSRSQCISSSSPELPPPMAKFSDLPTCCAQYHEQFHTSQSGTPHPPPSYKNCTRSPSTAPTRSNSLAAPRRHRRHECNRKSHLRQRGR